MKWISVKEQLPDKYEKVIVTNGKDVCLHYKQSLCNSKSTQGQDLYNIFCNGTSKICYDHGCSIFEDAIYWMPLPEVPTNNSDADQQLPAPEHKRNK